MWLTRFSLNRPVIIGLLFGGLAIFGVVSYLMLGRSENPPGVQYPLVYVAANYPGATPQDMEKLVIKPLEDQLGDLENVDHVDASAQEGEAEVDVTFNVGTNLDLAAIDVQRRVDTARFFMPTDLDPPVVGKAGSSEPMLQIDVTSKSLSPAALADIVTNQLEPQFKEIPNIQRVRISGTQTREFHVEPDPGKLLGLGATINDVFNAVSANNANVPGGRIDKPTLETSVDVLGTVNNAADLAAIPLPVAGLTGKMLRLGDVGSTSDSYVDQRYIAKVNGLPAVQVTLEKSILADEVKSTAIARQKLKTIEAQYPGLTFRELPAVADYTVKSLNGVWQSLLEGIFLTMIVMMLFLHAWRNAAVVMIAIPVSILSTFCVMKFLGFTFDFMSLMGLSLIIGILVDDSIVVLENITRHRDLGEDPINAAINGRTEIGGAAIAITLVDVIVFAPIAFIPGIIGMYLKEFALVIVIATLFSLLVSFTLTPLLAGRWSVKQRSAALPAWMLWLRKRRVSVITLLVALALFVIPWNYGRVLGIVLVALTLLNAFVQRYNDILEWYRTRALPFVLSHGYFVVFVCATLFFNALFLVGGGTVSAGLDLVIVGVLLLGLLLGFVYRGAYRRGQLNAIHYVDGASGSVIAIGVRHVLALVAKFGELPRFAALKNAYRFLVRSAAGMSANRRMTIATFGVPLVLAGLMPLLGTISTDFVPSQQTGEMSLSLSYPQGTPIGVTARNVDALTDGVMKLDGVQYVSSVVGEKPTAYGSTDGGNYADINVLTYPNRRGDTNKIIAQIRKLTYLTPGGDLQVAGDSGGGSGAAIFYGVTGPEDQIAPAADKIVQILRSTPGSVNVQSGAVSGAPRLNVQIDAQKAALLGVSPGAASTAARLALGGGVATKVRTSTGLVDVRVQFAPISRNDLTTLKNVQVRAGDGSLIPLGSIATFENTVAPATITRYNRQRVVNVTGDILPGYSLGTVTAPLLKAMSQPGFLPPGIQINAQGDTQFQNQTFEYLGISLITSFVLVYMLMVVLYGSFIEPFIVMFTVPMALIGALVGIAIMHIVNPQGGQSLNLLSGIGTIMLVGLVAKNGILLVDYSNTLHKRGQRVRDAVLQASSTRFRPILMTTFAMVFGMLPLALGFAEGAEWRQSMGTVIIGGLISSLILTLALVPMIYNSWMGFFERVADNRAVREELAPVGGVTANA